MKRLASQVKQLTTEKENVEKQKAQQIYDLNHELQQLEEDREENQYLKQRIEQLEKLHLLEAQVW